MDSTHDHDQPIHELRSAIESSCPHCGYDLRATLTLSGARCPECGAKLPFDLLRHHDPQRIARRRSRWVTIGVLGGVAVLGVVIVALNVQPPAAGWWQISGPGLAMLIGAMTATLIAFAVPRLGNYRPDIQLRLRLLIPVGIVASVLAWRSYPWQFGGFCALLWVIIAVVLARRSGWPARAVRSIRSRITLGEDRSPID